MGPCLFRHGNRTAANAAVKWGVASMGPCLFRHGNLTLAAAPAAARSFNGAVPFQARKCTITFKYVQVVSLQWGRAFSGTEIAM